MKPPVDYDLDPPGYYDLDGPPQEPCGWCLVVVVLIILACGAFACWLRG